MKPNFALTLSFEGIGLLHRAFPGWHMVGEVSLDSADLASELSLLRDKAAMLDPSGLRSKLVVPEDQIKYLRVETEGRDGDALVQKVRVTLEGATPYAVDDLVYDWVVEDGEVMIAAVARDTLTEAEAFANDHQFNPLCFNAIPQNGNFSGEPFFGATARANGEIERDSTPIRIVGTAKLPEPGAFAHVDAEAAEEAISAAIDEAAETPAVIKETSEATPEDAPLTAFASIRAQRDDLPRDAPKLSGASREPNVESPDTPAEDPAAPDIETVAPIPSIILSSEIPDPESESTELVPPPATAPKPITPKKGAFFTRRSKQIANLDPPKQPPPPKNETQRMTVFGARDAEAVGGKPRYLGIILTAVLLLFLAGVAAWASIFLDDGLAQLFRRDDQPKFATVPSDQTGVTDRTDTTTEHEDIVVASLPQTGAEIDDALREALTAPDPAELSPDEARARYAATGIWQKAPVTPNAPELTNLEDFFQASIDPRITQLDAIALAPVAEQQTDGRPQTPISPAPAGTLFSLDERGFVIATPGGALTPQGVVVYAGLPPLVPSSIPRRSSVAPDVAISAEELRKLAAVRPKLRPDDLPEQIERDALGGLTRNELAAKRPKLRPKSAQEVAAEETQPETDPSAVEEAIAEAAATANPFVTATAQAVTASLKPLQRPGNFEKTVQRSRKKQETVAVSASQKVAPRLPTVTSVAKQATQQNVLKLRKVNLIGVYGTPSSRRALVRLANGRYKKVKIGDRLDGGKVAAIGDSELRYVKNGRSVVLKMPKG